MNRLTFAAIAACLAAAACAGDPSMTPPPVPEGAVPHGTAVGSASVAGRIRYAGRPAAPEPISTESDAACHRRQEGTPLREDLLAAPDGSLRNVYVHVAAGLEGRTFAPPPDPVTLDQRGCVYRPHVVGVQVGQPLRLVNSDPTLHNVHTVSAANRAFNFGMPVEGQQSIRYFAAPEVMVKAKCDVHPWMAAWIGVSPHPFFAVTGEEGAFSLHGLPAGTYRLEAWHETLGMLAETVTLGEGESRTLDFTFPG
ncbi:MAG TPA: carboxypeptidase regulatory-like domain-containing protein [Candidatus Polarisedimenticolia bacterium]|nr:carboxypeptidase regulatory-like domain-containing protein [Candidatus Polarisedimenticolia bacterium]